MPEHVPVRYVRIQGAPRRIAEIEGFRDGKKCDRSRWRASNLFFSYDRKQATHAWSSSFTLNDIPKGSYLAVALEGDHGDEGVYAALRLDGIPVGAPDRAVSYPSNTWEYYNEERESHYTDYFPLEKNIAGKVIDVMVLVLEGGKNEFQPEVYLTAYPVPFEKKELILHEREQSHAR